MLHTNDLVLETPGGRVPATLPEALARLCDGTLLGFDGLAAHQRHAWDLFLYQTGALALVHAGDEAAAEDPAAWRALADPSLWRDRLAALTPGCADTAWSVVVEDATRPAFLQPPIIGGLERYKTLGHTPDEIDLLVTAKAHDVKPQRAALAEPRHWAFALVSLQTQQGYSGRGNFGIARMNGGFGSRPLLEVTPARDAAARFRRGVRAALRARRESLSSDGYFTADGLGLLWLEPWDDESGLALDDLDPLFVEVCRRIRLSRAAGDVLALGRPSEGRRVKVPDPWKGDLGDAWTPLKDGAALTIGGGFDYRLLARLVATGEFTEPPALATLADDPDDLWLHAVGLTRGQGKTEGLHERWLRVPRDMRRQINLHVKAGGLGQSMLVDADTVRKALRLGLLVFVQGGPRDQDGQKLNPKDERARPFLEALEARIDGMFFPHLFARLGAGADDASEAAWKQALARLTQELFDTGLDSLSPPETRRERAKALARLTFNRLLRKGGLSQPSAEEDAA